MCLLFSYTNKSKIDTERFQMLHLLQTKIFCAQNNFVPLFFVAILLISSGYHVLFETQTWKNIFHEKILLKKSTWVQPSPPSFNILELEWTQYHKAKYYGNRLFYSKYLLLLEKNGTLFLLHQQ